MLYESTYNQYFLEHSWGPWKKHLYISRDGESGKYTYKYPKEYYDKYRAYQYDKANAAYRNPEFKSIDERQNYIDKVFNKKADKDSEYYNSYYNDIDKVINRSVKAAVNALNFGSELKGKAEGYLNRFANAVANAWDSGTSKVSSYAAAGKSYVQGAGYLASTAAKVVAPKVSASVQNLVKGAKTAISNSWGKLKSKVSNNEDKKAGKTRDRVSKADELDDKINKRQIRV